MKTLKNKISLQEPSTKLKDGEEIFKIEAFSITYLIPNHPYSPFFSFILKTIQTKTHNFKIPSFQIIFFVNSSYCLKAYNKSIS